MIFTYQEKLFFLLIAFFSAADFFLRRRFFQGGGFCNQGIGWGISFPKIWILVISGLTLAIVLWLWYQSKNWRIRIALSLIFIGGAINLIDRIVLGCVRDYLYLPLFPSFNVADMMLSLGVGALVFLFFIHSERE